MMLIKIKNLKKSNLNRVKIKRRKKKKTTYQV